MLTNAENISDLEDSLEDDNKIMTMGSKSINGFCDDNGLSHLLKRRLLNLLRFHPVMTGRLLFEFSTSMLRKSDAINILKRHKTFYERLTGIIPCEEEFIQYLKFRPEVYLDAESMKEYLSEYMDNEVNKTYNFPKNKKYRKNQTIDITPHQTLSIETTSATVEDSNRDKKLSMREIALIYWYDRDNLSFSKSTAQQIAEAYRHTSKSSGLSLYKDHYLKVSNDEKQRTNNDTSVQYLNNIIPILTTDRGKREANEDLKKAHEFKEQKKKRLF